MRRLFMLFMALIVCFTGTAGAWEPLQIYAEEASQDSPEGETETELMPVLLDTDQVSTDEIILYSSACVVMDVNTGAILYYKNKLDRHYPASTTKIMTTLLALERGSLDDTVTFSENAVGSITWDSSNMELLAGNQLTLEQALYGIMLRSANEAANGVAEHISGSMEAFAREMTDYAISLGCRRTHFTNPSGLHDDDHYTTAKDLAIIASVAARNEEFRKITGTVFYNVENLNFKIKQPESETDENGKPTGETVETAEPEPEPYPLYNHHKMVSGEYAYEGCYGGKTGYTDEARNTLVTYVKRGDMDLVCVILDCPGGGNYIYMDTEKALDYSFANYERLTAEYNEAQAKLNYPHLTILDWYHTEPPLSAEEMYYPFLAEAFASNKTYTDNRRAQEALDSAIKDKSVKDFIEYSRMRHYKPLIIAGIALVIAVILLAFLLHRLIKIIKRKRSRMRYKKLRNRRINETAEQAVARALAEKEAQKAAGNGEGQPDGEANTAEMLAGANGGAEAPAEIAAPAPAPKDAP